MKKGISLVALVVTIIVLIILAGAVILTVLDVNIFEKAKLAKEQKNLKEVYVAVQNEVLGVQQEKIGLAVSTEFATHLQARLLKNYPTSNSTATYDTADNNIGITFDLSDKTYELSLDRKYRLTMLTTIETGDTSEFEKDLIKAMEESFDETNNVYTLLDIQQTLQEKYPNTEYIYYAKFIDNGEIIYVPSVSGNFEGILDNEGNFDILTSDNFLMKIENEGITKYIEDGQIKSQTEKTILTYIKKEDADELFEITGDKITKYIGEEDKVTIPSIILNEDNNDDMWSAIEGIGQYAFKEETATKVDVVTTLLTTDYTTFNNWGVADLVDAIEHCNLSSSQYYEEGMTKIEYGEAYINAQGGELIVEGSNLYTYIDDSYQITSTPKQNNLDIIIERNHREIIIYSYAFNNPRIKTITINSKIDKLESYAFANCPKLTDIYMTQYTKEEVQALTNYSSNKWGAPNATIHCKNNETL